MTKEEKELLLKDLCARLPYGVKVDLFGQSKELIGVLNDIISVGYDINDYEDAPIEDIKPYLRPLSSMMQGEWEEMTALIYPYGRVNLNNKNELLLWLSVEGNDMPIILMDNVFSWLKEHNFDYCGLIEKGLAIEAPEGMYSTNTN